jgi:hypothetical protein
MNIPMKLTHWIRMHEAGSRAARPIGLILMGQGTLAAAALGTDLLRLCGSCGSGDAVHATIAGIGLAGYLGLLGLLFAKAWTPLFFGVFAAAGIHLALAGLMIARQGFCPICAAAAALALLAPAVLLGQDPGAVRWISRATVPAFLLSGIVTWTLAGARDARAIALREEARDAAKTLLAETKPEGNPLHRSILELHVFESDHCPYCREFRESYEPRLAKEFPSLDIVYHDASGVPWVLRTPTLVIGGEVAFEGLPVNYQDLSRAISRARGSKTTTDR